VSNETVYTSPESTMSTPNENDPLQLERSSLSEQAYTKLRSIIVTGTLKPGERLVERQLAQRMGVSRTPLREAMIRLEHEGLLTALPAGGLIVTSLDEDEVRALYAIRIALEGYATRLAAERAPAERVAELNGIVEQQRTALSALDLSLLEELNWDFHMALYATGEVEALAQLIETYRQRAFSHRIYDIYEPDELRRGVDEHGEIVEAVRHHRGDRAESIMRRHIASGAAIVIQRRVAATVNRPS
jgi:DNA-binding GntR family transcriptional regulator